MISWLFSDARAIKAYIRRKDLGLIAGEYSKKVYLVAEDPGKEPVQQISEDIAQYVAQKNCPYEIIEDRGVAIHKAIMECKRPTVLLITGKGNETRQKNTARSMRIAVQMWNMSRNIWKNITIHLHMYWKIRI